jgi:hypothetical protein
MSSDKHMTGTCHLVSSWLSLLISNKRWIITNFDQKSKVFAIGRNIKGAKRVGWDSNINMEPYVDLAWDIPDNPELEKAIMVCK